MNAHIDQSAKAVRAMALSALGFSLYAIGDVFIKMGADYYNPAQVGIFINYFSIPLLLILSSKIGGLRNTIRSKNKHLHVVRALLGVVSFIAMTVGFKELGMAQSYTLIFISPFVATILAVVFLSEKIHFHRCAAIAVGFTGVLVVLRPGMIPLEPAALAILFGAVCYAGSSIIVRKMGEAEPLLAISLYALTIHSLLYGAYMAWEGMAFFPSFEHLWYFAATSILHVFGGFAVFRALTTGETSIVAPFHYVQLLWGAAFGYLVFNQGIDIWTAAGAAIIVGSGLYMIHRERVRRREITHGVVISPAVPVDAVDVELIEEKKKDVA